MKLTRRQLRRVISEEVRRLLDMRMLSEGNIGNIVNTDESVAESVAAELADDPAVGQYEVEVDSMNDPRDNKRWYVRISGMNEMEAKAVKKYLSAKGYTRYRSSSQTFGGTDVIVDP